MDPLKDLNSRADWQWVSNLYKQFTDTVQRKGKIPPEVSAALARSLGRVLAHYEDKEEQFFKDAFDLMAHIDHLALRTKDAFSSLYGDPRLRNILSTTPRTEMNVGDLLPLNR